MKLLPALFSIALFICSFLSFSVQPMLGKMLLPVVGGAPSVWIVAMAFFQLALLAGYGLSYFLQRLNVWVHVGVLLLCYCFGWLSLPPSVPSVLNLSEYHVSMSVMLVLARTIFPSFLALTATTSALQRVLSVTNHPTARDPYYLFIASNLGSFTGLLSYPLLLEFLFGLHWQAELWQVLYGVMVALLFSCGVLAWKNRNRQTALHETLSMKRASVSYALVGKWLILSFVPCSLSIGISSLLTNDVGGVPLLWVLPLGLYLLTFVFAFAQNPRFSLAKLQRDHVYSVGFLLCVIAIGLGFRPTADLITFVGIIFLLLQVFFCIALSCHQQLAVLRPSVDHLTLYYFSMAIGGAIAGLVHVFILPLVLHDMVEFPVMVLLSLLVLPAFYKPWEQNTRFVRFAKFVPFCVAASLVLTVLLCWMQVNYPQGVLYGCVAGAFVVVFISLSARPRVMFGLGIIILALTFTISEGKRTLVSGRNFFGTYKVVDVGTKGQPVRMFVHGNTTHGTEPLNVSKRIKYNSSYYSRTGPAGDVIQAAAARSLGVIGLGAGQLACLQPDLQSDFYEIDPDVVQVAQKYFTYLATCKPRDIFIGDGRLELAKADRRYDVLVLDAFSSDGIPMHIITREALEMYRTHLTAKGIMAFHISNRYFNLAPFLASAARAMGLKAYVRLHHPDQNAYPLAEMSKWLAIPLSQQQRRLLQKKGWHEVVPTSTVWTDDKASVLQSLSMTVFER